MSKLKTYDMHYAMLTKEYDRCNPVLEA